jgi:hypothetical protein
MMTQYQGWEAFMERVGILTRAVVAQAPIWIVWLVGIVFAIARWRRHTMVSLLTIVALLVLAGSSVLGPLAGRWLFFGLRNLGWGGSQFLLTGLWSFGLALVKALGWALLLAAIFGWRSEPS